MPSEDVTDLRRKGEQDLERLEEKIKEALKKNIRQYITQEAIITGNGEKKVKIPIKGLQLPEFRFSEGKGNGSEGIGSGNGDLKEGDKVQAAPANKAGEGTVDHMYEEEVSIDDLVELAFSELGLPDMDENAQRYIASATENFNDIRKCGPVSRLDIKRTLKNNLRRNIIAGQPRIKGFIKDDLRYKSYEIRYEFKTNAVILAMMDVSGSMTDHKKYLVRMTLFWIKKYLERIYEGLTFAFIIHDTEAKEVGEELFFHTTTGGGTYISSACKLAKEVIDKNFNPSEWNIYAFYFSDGENWENDNETAVASIEELLGKCKMFYYGQVGDERYGTFNETLEKGIDKHESIVISIIKNESEIANGIERFLNVQRGPLKVAA